MPLKGQELHRREGLLLELITESGAVGIGEASPLPGFSDESIEDCVRQLGSLTASWIGRKFTMDWPGPEGAFSRELDEASLSPASRFGIELALWNLYAASEGKPLTEVLCTLPVDSVAVNGLLSGSVGQVLSEGLRMRGTGYEAVKLKVGGRDVEDDAKLVGELSEVLGGDIELRLDANRAWSFAQAIDFSRALEGVEYAYIEEPLSDPMGLVDLARDHGVPVALDESLVGMEPEELGRHGHARAAIIKPTMIGGISRALRFAEEARRMGIMPVLSSSYETGIGTEALLALAAATGGGRIAAGLDTYRRLGADVILPPLDMSRPRIDLRRIARARRGLYSDYLSVIQTSES